MTDFDMHFDPQIPRETDVASGLPIGPRLVATGPAPRPERITLEGRYCRLEPFDASRHAEGLFQACTPPDAGARFLYLSEEPPRSVAEMHAWMTDKAKSQDPLFFTVIDATRGRALGRQALMRIEPTHRVIEIGSIYWGPEMSRSRISTEAQYLFMKYAFELGYRRYEWKCNALNAPSRAAALRFGFVYEGHFRRAAVVKGRSRDTSWFSILDEEWPALQRAYETWLRPANFDEAGRQRQRLSALTRIASSETSVQDGA
ncbi:GNAT family N-acetyltransferase [Rubrivivax rivuli]|nr:GNAT family protein [Rubrivivax rivuli]